MKIKIIFLIVVVVCLIAGRLIFKRVFKTEQIENMDYVDDGGRKKGGSREKSNSTTNRDSNHIGELKEIEASGNNLDAGKKSNEVISKDSKSSLKGSLVDLNNNLNEKDNQSTSPFYKMAVEGVKLMSEGNFEKGLEKLNEVLQKDPSNEIALEGLGLYYLEEGKNLEKAQQYFQKLIEINPNNSVAVNEMAYVLEETGGVERVESFLRELSEKNPNSASISSALAQTLTRVGKLEEAIPHLENSINSSFGAGDRISATYGMEDLANLYIETNNIPEAIRNLRRILSLKQQHYQEMVQKGEKGEILEEIKEEALSTRLELARNLMSDNIRDCDEANGLLREVDPSFKDDPGYQILLKEASEKCQ